MVEIYKNHTIVGAGILDEKTRRHAPIASVSWTTKGGKREMRVLDAATVRYVDEEDAGLAALAEAKVWVDERLKSLD